MPEMIRGRQFGTAKEDLWYVPTLLGEDVPIDRGVRGKKDAQQMLHVLMRHHPTHEGVLTCSVNPPTAHDYAQSIVYALHFSPGKPPRGRTRGRRGRWTVCDVMLPPGNSGALRLFGAAANLHFTGMPPVRLAYYRWERTLSCRPRSPSVWRASGLRSDIGNNGLVVHDMVIWRGKFYGVDVGVRDRKPSAATRESGRHGGTPAYTYWQPSSVGATVYVDNVVAGGRSRDFPNRWQLLEAGSVDRTTPVPVGHPGVRALLQAARAAARDSVRRDAHLRRELYKQYPDLDSNLHQSYWLENAESIIRRRLARGAIRGADVEVARQKADLLRHVNGKPGAPPYMRAVEVADATWWPDLCAAAIAMAQGAPDAVAWPLRRDLPSPDRATTVWLDRVCRRHGRRTTCGYTQEPLAKPTPGARFCILFTAVPLLTDIQQCDTIVRFRDSAISALAAGLGVDPERLDPIGWHEALETADRNFRRRELEALRVDPQGTFDRYDAALSSRPTYDRAGWQLVAIWAVQNGASDNCYYEFIMLRVARARRDEKGNLLNPSEASARPYCLPYRS